MDLRAVLRHTCDERGAIAFLFGEWGAVASATAIEQIEVGACSYFLPLPRGAVAIFQPVETGCPQALRIVGQLARLMIAAQIEHRRLHVHHTAVVRLVPWEGAIPFEARAERLRCFA